MRAYLCIALLLWSSCFSAALRAADEYSIKATFVYRFAQFTQWPPPPRTQIRICLLEHPELLAAFGQLSFELDVKPINDTRMLENCDVLMLGMSNRQALQEWRTALDGRPMLVVTDNAEAYRQLGMIQLLTSPDGINFQVNLERTKAHQLKLGSQLLKLAQQVD